MSHIDMCLVTWNSYTADATSLNCGNLFALVVYSTLPFFHVIICTYSTWYFVLVEGIWVTVELMAVVGVRLLSTVEEDLIPVHTAGNLVVKLKALLVLRPKESVKSLPNRAFNCRHHLHLRRSRLA